MSSLLEGLKETANEEGLYHVVDKTLTVIDRRLKGAHRGPRKKVDNHLFDVVFINGCDYSVPHPVRYRVDHQVEQLLAAGMSALKVEAAEADEELLRHGRVFVIFRCPVTNEIRDFIAKAKKLNKRVIYDIDDLVIDTAYTDQIPFVAKMDASDKALYDDGVKRMGETLSLCDCAITTTEALADELKKYVPRVYVNRNTASMTMVDYSEIALYRRDLLPNILPGDVPAKDKKMYKLACERIAQKEATGEVRLGYFSGSITHNSDFDIIKDALLKVMDEHENVTLMIGGELDVNSEFKRFGKRVITFPFCDWRRLPKHISSCDVNLAPLEDTLFNRAKSENKWVEAALVKVPTIASNVGAFAHMISDGQTGLLCDNTTEAWYEGLSRVVANKELRASVAEKAYKYCSENCTTVGAAKTIRDIIVAEQKPNIVMVLPSLNTSGGVLVALRHLCMLQDAGWDVFIANTDDSEQWLEVFDHKIPVLNREVPSGKIDKCPFHATIDVGVATLWDTLDFLNRYPKMKKKKYLVQNLETDFYLAGDPLRLQANATYLDVNDVEYLTISPWCQNWLKDRFGQKSTCVPNGLELEAFTPVERDFSQGKIRVLIEGDCNSEYKNVDESFRIVQLLDPEKFEIWYMTYTGIKKPWYRVDNFLGSVPHEQVADVYRQCHILLKTSVLESFSYPPLEMMATGGFVVAVPNDGNAEFVRDGENCLTYKQGDVEAGAKAINDIADDAELRERLYAGGLETAKTRDWSSLEPQIVEMYR